MFMILCLIDVDVKFVYTFFCYVMIDPSTSFSFSLFSYYPMSTFMHKCMLESAVTHAPPRENKKQKSDGMLRKYF